MSLDERNISRFAKEFGLTQRALRHYESLGLLRPLRLYEGRLYTFVERSRIRVIIRAKQMGFSLADIKAGLDQAERPDKQVEWEEFMSKMPTQTVAAQLQALKSQKQRVFRAIAYLERALNERGSSEHSADH